MAQVGVRAGGPVPAQVVDGLGQVVGDGPHVGRLAGPGHGHVGQFPAPAVGEEVGPLGGRALGTMDGERNAKLVLGVVLERDALGMDLYRRKRPPWRGLGGAG